MATAFWIYCPQYLNTESRGITIPLAGRQSRIEPILIPFVLQSVACRTDIHMTTRWNELGQKAVTWRQLGGSGKGNSLQCHPFFHFIPTPPLRLGCRSIREWIFYEVSLIPPIDSPFNNSWLELVNLEPSTTHSTSPSSTPLLGLVLVLLLVHVLRDLYEALTLGSFLPKRESPAMNV